MSETQTETQTTTTQAPPQTTTATTTESITAPIHIPAPGEGRINRALARATGANIHSIRVLAGYYRLALDVPPEVVARWPLERQLRRETDIARYEWVLDHFASVGKFPVRAVPLDNCCCECAHCMDRDHDGCTNVQGHMCWEGTRAGTDSTSTSTK